MIKSKGKETNQYSRCSIRILKMQVAARKKLFSYYFGSVFYDERMYVPRDNYAKQNKRTKLKL